MPPDSDHWYEVNVQPHVPMLRAWLLSQFPQQRDIEDVVQEAIMRVLRARTTGEVRAPSLLFQTLQPLAFVDGGLAVNKRLLPGEPRSTALLGAGPGLRFALGSSVALRADHGWRLRRLADAAAPARRWHLSAAVHW